MLKTKAIFVATLLSCSQIALSQSQLDFLGMARQVDNVQEWISLGPRPIISIELESGSADLFVRICGLL